MNPVHQVCLECESVYTQPLASSCPGLSYSFRRPSALTTFSIFYRFPRAPPTLPILILVSVSIARFPPVPLLPGCSHPSPLRWLHIFVLPITHTCSFQLFHPLAILPSFSTYLFSFCNHFYSRRNHASHPPIILYHKTWSTSCLLFIILDSSFLDNLTFRPCTFFLRLPHLVFLRFPISSSSSSSSPLPENI